MHDLTRPIIGIENRTAQEVFDIMVERIRSAPPIPVSLSMGNDARCGTYEDILRVVCGHLELPQWAGGCLRKCRRRLATLRTPI